MSLAQRIADEMTVLPGVSAEPHRFGGVEFRVNGREIGHLHGDSWADIPFPKRVRDKLVAEGRAEVHHLLKDTGWISFYVRKHADGDRLLALLMLNYRIITNRRQALAEFGG
ncbi:MAG: DUF5519 family protein [Chloroflexi bacterium]|nr:DUF5519 family protein [Chloroflexota bacterium]